MNRFKYYTVLSSISISMLNHRPTILSRHLVRASGFKFYKEIKSNWRFVRF